MGDDGSIRAAAARVVVCLLGDRALTVRELAEAVELPRYIVRDALALLLNAGRVATDPATLAYRIRAERGWCPGCGDGPGGGGRVVYCSRCRWTAPELRALWSEEPEG
jgi:hypothetical protein